MFHFGPYFTLPLDQSSFPPGCKSFGFFCVFCNSLPTTAMVRPFRSWVFFFILLCAFFFLVFCVFFVLSVFFFFFFGLWFVGVCFFFRVTPDPCPVFLWALTSRATFVFPLIHSDCFFLFHAPNASLWTNFHSGRAVLGLGSNLYWFAWLLLRFSVYFPLHPFFGAGKPFFWGFLLRGVLVLLFFPWCSDLHPPSFEFDLDASLFFFPVGWQGSVRAQVWMHVFEGFGSLGGVTTYLCSLPA